MRRTSGKGWLFRSVALALVASLTVFAVACGSDDDDEDATPSGGATSAATKAATQPASGGDNILTIKKGEAIKIGISTTLTTDNAELGLPIEAAAKYAASKKTDIKGFKLETVSEDDLCSGPGSVTAAEKLVSDNVAAVVGPMCSGGAVAAIPVYGEDGVLVVSASATGVIVTQQGGKSFFRVAWNDATQGGEMAKYAYTTLAKKNAVLVNDQSVYGKGLMEVFGKSFKELGGTVASEEAVTVGEKDFSPVVTKIKGENPDIVVFGGFIAEGAVLVKQLRDAGVTASFMGADGIADQKFVDQAQGAADGAYVSRGPVPTDTSAYDKFAADFTAATGEKPGQFAEQAFDSVNVILAAIEKVAVVNSAGDLEIDRDKLIEAVRATKTTGASGEISFNEVGDRVVTAGVVNRIDQVKNNALERIQ